MKKIYSVLLLAAILTMVTFYITAVTDNNGVGPAPNSGDGVPDGSGF